MADLYSARLREFNIREARNKSLLLCMYEFLDFVREVVIQIANWPFGVDNFAINAVLGFGGPVNTPSLVQERRYKTKRVPQVKRAPLCSVESHVDRVRRNEQRGIDWL